jgi:hypothetical protein
MDDHGISKGLIVIVVHLGRVWSPRSHFGHLGIMVVQRMHSSLKDKSLAGVVVEDVKSLAASTSSPTFRHVSRSCNNSAHIFGILLLS